MFSRARTLGLACAIVCTGLAALSCDDNGTIVPPDRSRPAFHGIGGWTEFDLYAVGDGGAIERYRGVEFRKVASPTSRNLRDIVGFSASSAFAVGDGGTILRYNGTTFSLDTSPTTSNLSSIWGESGSNLIAVGAGGVIVENDGGGWQTATSPVTGDLEGVWALSTGEAYAVGAGGTIAHRVAGAWSAPAPFTNVRLRAVWADKPRDWFAVGDGGEIWQERGAGWSPMTSPRTDDLYDVHGSDSAYVFAVGETDSILFYDQLAWRALAPNPAGRLESIWATICAIPPAPRSNTDAGVHCSNTYFAGRSGVVTRYTLLGSYERLADLRGARGGWAEAFAWAPLDQSRRARLRP